MSDANNKRKLDEMKPLLGNQSINEDRKVPGTSVTETNITFYATDISPYIKIFPTKNEREKGGHWTVADPADPNGTTRIPAKDANGKEIAVIINATSGNASPMVAIVNSQMVPVDFKYGNMTKDDFSKDIMTLIKNRALLTINIPNKDPQSNIKMDTVQLPMSFCEFNDKVVTVTLKNGIGVYRNGMITINKVVGAHIGDQMFEPVLIDYHNKNGEITKKLSYPAGLDKYDNLVYADGTKTMTDLGVKTPITYVFKNVDISFAELADRLDIERAGRQPKFQKEVQATIEEGRQLISSHANSIKQLKPCKIPETFLGNKDKNLFSFIPANSPYYEEFVRIAARTVKNSGKYYDVHEGIIDGEMFAQQILDRHKDWTVDRYESTMDMINIGDIRDNEGNKVISINIELERDDLPGGCCLCVDIDDEIEKRKKLKDELWARRELEDKLQARRSEKYIEPDPPEPEPSGPDIYY